MRKRVLVFCQGPKTAQEKRDTEVLIKQWNRELEPILQEEWELSNRLRRLNLRQLPGQKPTWRWNKSTGKLTREKSKRGIDWFRYYTKILIPRLLLFAQQYMIERPNTLVQEDKAPSYSHRF